MTMTAMTMTMFRRDRRGTESTADLPVREAGPVVLGYTGSEASRRALVALPHVVDLSGGVVVVVAVNRPRPPRARSRAADALGGDGYLLSDRAVSEETLRQAREQAAALRLNLVNARTVVDDPVHALSAVAREVGALAVVVGMNGERPTRQIRALGKALRDVAPLVVTNGTTSVRTEPQALRAATPRVSRAMTLTTSNAT